MTEKIKIRKADSIITISPVDGSIPEKKYSCPFLGIAAGGKLTVDKFLEWKREEREIEHEKDLHS